ncbi:MAG: cobalt ABC transporter permease [Rhodobacterales bacterium]|nr:cobalt ABC transporter permease [Rhodobacterales bacterium]
MAFALAFTLALPGGARAHKVVAAVYAEGRVIEGEVGFSNGDMAADADVVVTAPDGRELGRTRTDADGLFTFTPTEAVDHHFTANLGAGHVAQVTLPAADLPRGLAPGGAAPARMDSTPVAEAGASAALPPDLSEQIAAAVRREVKPLRKEIAAYRERNDLQAILGGIGYILGLFGLGFYLMARRRLNRDAP